ncbi:hypothetical protein, partial [Streptomyces sp. TRM70350]|uniref:hypothetical protein n=1 Tax=Streptomyces sp. TRM70350 TaxID=2856165 RepID=UPI00210F4D88
MGTLGEVVGSAAGEVVRGAAGEVGGWGDGDVLAYAADVAQVVEAVAEADVLGGVVGGVGCRARHRRLADWGVHAGYV